MNNLDEYRKMDRAARMTALKELLKEHFNLRMQKGTGQLDKPHLLRSVSRNIARLKTLMRGETA